MIKLISQFDDKKMRASVATPTCGPCCCCCCVVTAITSSIVTARHFGNDNSFLMMEEGRETRELRREVGFGNKVRTAILFLLNIIGMSMATFLTSGFIMERFDSYSYRSMVNFFITVLVLTMIFYALQYIVYIYRKGWGVISVKNIIIVSFCVIASFIVEFFLWLAILY